MLHTLGEVWLPDGILQQHNKLALQFFCPACITENVASHINLGPENTVHEGLDWLIQMWQSCLGEPVCLVKHKPIELPIGALLVSDEFKNVCPFQALPSTAKHWLKEFDNVAGR